MKPKRSGKVFNHSGSSFDRFLDEEGMREEVESIAVKRVLAWRQESRHPDSRCESWADRACFPIKSPVARDLEFSPFDAAALSRRVRGGQFDREMRSE